MFSLKFPQLITHIKMLKDCQYETEVFLNRLKCLAKNLELCFCSFRQTLALSTCSDLEDFLQKLPNHNRYVVEVRNKSWLNQDFYSLLKANKVALAWADSVPNDADK